MTEKTLSARISRELDTRLSILAVTANTSKQALVTEAVEELLRKYEEVESMSAIHADIIWIGKAYEEGRAPSHDGEYLTVYYVPGGDDYIVTDNAGVAWTSFNWSDVRNDVNTNCDPEDVEEFERQLDEAERIVREQTGELVESMSPAARGIAREWGWLVPEEIEHTTETRRESYEQILDKRASRRKLVLDTLGTRQLTAGELTELLLSRGYIDYYDRNFVAPRLTELKDIGLVETVGKRTCKRTGRAQAVWARVEEVSK